MDLASPVASCQLPEVQKARIFGKLVPKGTRPVEFTTPGVARLVHERHLRLPEQIIVGQNRPAAERSPSPKHASQTN